MTLCYKETKIGKFALRPIPVLLLEKKGFSKSLIRLYNSLTSLNFDWPSNQTKHEFTPTGIDRFSPFCTWNTYSSWIWTPEIPIPGGCVYSHCVGNEISELNSYIKFIRYYLYKYFSTVSCVCFCPLLPIAPKRYNLDKICFRILILYFSG